MLNIVIASDSNYLHLVSTCIVSLFETNPDGKFHIHLLSNEIGEVDLDALKIIIERYQGHWSIYPIDDLRERLAIDVPSTISLTSYARLFVASILPPDLDKILYIDCDIMFNGNIRQLFDIDFADNLIGGVLDPLISHTYKKELKISKNEPYINAGVLMIPLQRWRKEGMEQKFVDYLVANKGNVHHHDQGIINAVCKGRKVILNPKFNVMSNCFSYGWANINGMMHGKYYNKTTFMEAIEKPAIIHFTGADMGRPWTDDCHHPFKEQFLKYYTKLPDAKIQHAYNSSLIELEKWMFRNLPFRLFTFAMRSINNLAYIKHRLNKYRTR